MRLGASPKTTNVQNAQNSVRVCSMRWNGLRSQYQLPILPPENLGRHTDKLPTPFANSSPGVCWKCYVWYTIAASIIARFRVCLAYYLESDNIFAMVPPPDLCRIG
jgi:hypothetical protein